MDLDSSTKNAYSSTLLSDLLQSYSKGDKDSSRDNKDELRDEFKDADYNKSDFKSDFKNENDLDHKDSSIEFNKTDLTKSNDNRDDRPDQSPEQSKQSTNQMEIDQQECAIKESFNSNKFPTSTKNPLSIVAEMLRSKGQTNSYKIEDDFYADLPANTPLQELVRCALTKQGYSVEDCSAAKGKF